MAEHPILFTGEMVRTILEGHKTMTRRVVKPQPQQAADGNWDQSSDGKWLGAISRDGSKCNIACPHGKPGDTLWVRETFSAWFSALHWYDTYSIRCQSRLTNLFYRATHHYPDDDQKWVPSIFMPRWASRITLEVTGVRVERVQDIGFDDVVREGVWSLDWAIDHTKNMRYPTWKQAWVSTWDTINAKRGYGWDVNPWVWVVEFTRCEHQTEVGNG